MLLIVIMSLYSTKILACRDYTVNELGWSFQLSKGWYMLFGLKSNDTIPEADLVVVKTDNFGDTLSVKEIKNVPVTFSFSDIMDMDSAGNFILAGVRDSTGTDWFRIIKYSADVNTMVILTYPIPTDSFVLATLFDWRYIKGKGFLFFGQNRKSGYSTAFLSNSGQSYYTSGGDFSYELSFIGDAAQWNNNIVITGDYTKGIRQGIFIEILSQNGKILNQKFYPVDSSVKTEGIQLCINNNAFYILGFYNSNTAWKQFYCIKSNQLLDTVWTKIFPLQEIARDSLITSLSILGNTPIHNNSFGILLKTYENNVPINDILLKIDSSGNINFFKNLSIFNSTIFNFNENASKQIIMVGTLNNEQTIDLHLIILDSTLSGTVAAKNKSDAFSIYPNPVSGNLYLNGISSNSNSTYVYVSDATGKSVLSAYINKDECLNTDKLKPGIYFLNLIPSNGISYTNSFVVK